jgi:hypothetical protein
VINIFFANRASLFNYEFKITNYGIEEFNIRVEFIE